jgi:hypothetical protein
VRSVFFAATPLPLRLCKCSLQPPITECELQAFPIIIQGLKPLSPVAYMHIMAPERAAIAYGYGTALLRYAVAAGGTENEKGPGA